DSVPLLMENVPVRKRTSALSSMRSIVGGDVLLISNVANSTSIKPELRTEPAEERVRVLVGAVDPVYVLAARRLGPPKMPKLPPPAPLPMEPVTNSPPKIPS